MCAHLLGVLKLPPETLIHSFGGLLRTTHHGLDIDLKASVQKLVYLPVIIVIIPEDGRENTQLTCSQGTQQDKTYTTRTERGTKKVTDLMPNMQWM